MGVVKKKVVDAHNAEHIWNVLDKDGNGELGKKEFLRGLNTLQNDERNAKLFSAIVGDATNQKKYKAIFEEMKTEAQGEKVTKDVFVAWLAGHRDDSFADLDRTSHASSRFAVHQK